MTDEQGIVAELRQADAVDCPHEVEELCTRAAARIEADAATIAALREELAEARGEPDRIVAWLRTLGPWEHISPDHVRAHRPANLADAIAARAYVENTND